VDAQDEVFMTPRFKDVLERNVGALALFVCGGLLFPAFLFQTDLGVRAAEVIVFFIGSALCGRRVRFVSNLLVAAGIIVFNLVIPSGRVLVSVLGIPVTDEALRGGVSKATAVIGMIALSQLSIRTTLRLPGTLGGLIGRTFLYFERIMGERRRLGKDRIMERIDQLLMSIHGDAEAPGDIEAGGRDSSAQDAEKPGGRTTPAGFIGLGIAVGVAWGLLVLTRLHPGLIWAR
jgi:hypothetical protein